MSDLLEKTENDLIQDQIESIQAALEDAKAEEIVVYYLKENIISDAVIVSTANNPNHSKALIRSVSQALNMPQSSDQSEGWAVVDLNTIMLHILHPDLRRFYDIDAWFAQKSDQVVHL